MLHDLTAEIRWFYNGVPLPQTQRIQIPSNFALNEVLYLIESHHELEKIQLRREIENMKDQLTRRRWWQVFVWYKEKPAR